MQNVHFVNRIIEKLKLQDIELAKVKDIVNRIIEKLKFCYLQIVEIFVCSISRILEKLK